MAFSKRYHRNPPNQPPTQPALLRPLSEAVPHPTSQPSRRQCRPGHIQPGGSQPALSFLRLILEPGMEPGQQPLCVSLRGPGESVPAPVLPRDTFGQSRGGTFPSRPRGPYRSPPSTSSRGAAKGTEIQSRRILLPLKKRPHPQSSLRFLTPAQRRRVRTLLLSPSVKSAQPASPPPPRARPCPCRHAGLPQPGAVLTGELSGDQEMKSHS